MEKLLTTSFFLVNPVFGFLGLIVLKNKRKVFYLLISLLIAYYGFCIPPVLEMDLYRHYELFDNIVIGNFDVENSKYFGMYILCYVIKFFSLPKELLPFISLFLNYYILLSICYNEIRKNKEIKTRDYFFLTLFILFNVIPFSHCYSGIRFPIGMSLAFYTIYKKLNKKMGNIKFLIITLLAISFHKFITIIFIIYFISIFFKMNYRIEKKLRILIFGLLIFLSYNEGLFIKIFNIIPEEFQREYGMRGYLLGEESNEKFGFGGASYFFSQRNIIGKTVIILEDIFRKYFYIFYVMINRKIDNFVLILTYIILICFKFQAFSIRYTYILSYFLTIYIIRRYKKVNTVYFEIFTLIIIVFNIFLWKDKSYFFTGIVDFIFSIPLLKILGIN